MTGDTYEMKLSKPIEAHGEQVSTLTLRDPESGMLDGVEITIGPHGLRLDLGAVVKVIGAAADIPTSASRKIPMRDIFSNLEGILSFLELDIRTTGQS